jgi:hypothetical protein
MSKSGIVLVRKSGNEGEGVVAPFVYRALPAAGFPSALQLVRTGRPHAPVIEILPPVLAGEDSDPLNPTGKSEVEQIETACRLFEENPTSIFLDVVA